MKLPSRQVHSAGQAPGRDTLVLLAILGAMLFVSGLGMRDPWPADEPRYALIARDMVRSGEWWIPRIGGELYPDKPPLFFWSVAACLKLTGSLRVGFLLPSLLAGIGCLLLVHDLARRLWGAEAALSATLLLACTVQFTQQARSGQIDALLSFWTTLGLYGLARHLLLGPHWRWYWLGCVAAGLGVITKGVGFLPLLILLPWLVLRRRSPTRWPVGWSGPGAGLRWAGGLLFLLLPIFFWLLPMLWHVQAAGSHAFAAYRDDILLRQTVERFAAPWHHHKPPWYYVVNVIPWAWFPVTLLAPWLVSGWRRRLRSGEPAIALLLGWAACVLAFFSLSAGKRGVYLLPALPAIVLASAPLLPALGRDRRVRAACRVACGSIGLLAAAVLAWIALGSGGLPQIDDDLLAPVVVPVLAAVALLALAALLAAPRLERLGGGVAALLLLLAGIWTVQGVWLAPRIDPIRSGTDLMAQVDAAMPGDGELGLVGWKEQFLLHARRPVVHFGFRRNPDDEMRDAVAWLSAAPGRRLLIAASRMSPCLDADAALPIAHRHQREWRLAGPDSITGSCAPTSRALHTRRYDPVGAIVGPPD